MNKAKEMALKIRMDSVKMTNKAHSGHVGSMYSFLSSVATGVPSAPTFADGAYVQRVMEAAYRSNRTGKAEIIEST